MHWRLELANMLIGGHYARELFAHGIVPGNRAVRFYYLEHCIAQGLV